MAKVTVHPSCVREAEPSKRNDQLIVVFPLFSSPPPPPALWPCTACSVPNKVRRLMNAWSATSSFISRVSCASSVISWGELVIAFEPRQSTHRGSIMQLFSHSELCDTDPCNNSINELRSTRSRFNCCFRKSPSRGCQAHRASTTRNNHQLINQSMHVQRDLAHCVACVMDPAEMIAN